MNDCDFAENGSFMQAHKNNVESYFYENSDMSCSVKKMGLTRPPANMFPGIKFYSFFFVRRPGIAR